ncbi:MAG: hypothetical protein GY858_00035 [Candidatus Omnitrophica bacterium]|nr:hypothetical protein [Candidatus Omnitrophota bacterium]
MVRHVDAKEREESVLALVIDSYIKESKPISSSYLCAKYNLAYSSATVRNVMEALERRGLLSHVHTSSGRVPTEEGFKYYIAALNKERLIKEHPAEIDSYSPPVEAMDEAINHALSLLARVSGYTSMAVVSNRDNNEERMFLRGTRFILDQPEFEDVALLRDLFHIFEVNTNSFQSLLHSCFNEDLRIFVGDEMGLDNISGCSLVVSGCGQNNISFTLGLLGPMRMNYERAISSVCSMKECLFNNLMEDF